VEERGKGKDASENLANLTNQNLKNPTRKVHDERGSKREIPITSAVVKKRV